MDTHRDQRADVNRQRDAIVTAGHDVADSVAAENCDAPLVEPWQARGVEAGKSDAHRIPSAFDFAHRGPAGANHQHIALFDVNLLRFLGGVEVLRKNFVARLHPFDFFQPRDIEKDAAADNAGAGDVDRAFFCAMRSDFAGVEAVVHFVLPEHVQSASI